MADLNTEIKIGADASGVEAGVTKAKRSLKDLGAAAQQAGKDAGAGMASVGAGGDQAAKKVDSATRSMQNSLQRLIAEQKAGGKASREYYEALADTKGISRGAIKPLLDQLDAAKAKTLSAESAAKSWKSSIASIGPAIAAAFSVAAITGVVGKVVAVQREFDILNSSLKTVTGSSAAAERELAWLKTFAKETPFGLSQATQGFVKMKALGLDPTRAALTSFGNTASAMGKDLNQMIEAVADASTGEFERLKEFGIKAKKQGDDVSLTFQGVTKTIGNSAKEITKYLEDIGNNQFAGAMEERAKTLDGTIAALGDSWDELFRTVSTNNVGTLIFDSVTLANGAIEDATTILKAMGGAAQNTGKDLGILSAVQGGIATVFETVSVLGVNLKYVLVGIGLEVKGLAQQVFEAARFNFSGVAAIRAQMVSDAQAARKEIDATTERILNARKEQERFASYATRNASAATDPRRLDVGGSTAGVKGLKATAKAVKAAVTEYDKLIKKLGEDIPKAAADAEAAQMGYNKAQTEFLALARSPEWAKFTSGQRANVAALFATKIASEQAGDAITSLAKAQKEFEASRQKEIGSHLKEIEALGEKAQKLEDEVKYYGMSQEAIESLTTARMLDQIEVLRGMDNSAEEIARIEETIAARKRLAAAGTAKDSKVAAEKYADDMLKEQKKAAEESGKYWEDALMRAFESGKGFFQSLWDTIKNTLKTQVLKVTVQGVMGSLGVGAAGVAQAGQAASTGSSLMSAASMAGSIYNAGAATLGGLSSGATSLAGIMTATGSQVATAVSYGTAIGSTQTAMLAAQEAGMGLAGSMGTLGTALAAVPVWGWAALAGLAVLGMSGNRYTSTQSTGYASRKYGADGSLLSSSTDANGIGEAGGVLDSIYKSIAGVQASLGAKGGASITYNSNTGRESKDPQFYLKTGSYDSGEIQKNDANVSLAISRTILTAIQDSELPKYLQGAFDGMVAGSMSQEQINAAITGGQALKAFNDELLALPFANLADMSFAATQSLIGFSGGLDQLKGNLASYYENFYTDAEKTANVTRDVAAALADVGLQMPTTRDEFRALVEAQMALGDSGTGAVAALLGVSGAFASVTAASETAAEAAARLADDQGKAAAEAARRAEEVARERAGLQRNLLTELGDTNALRRLELDALDASNRALQERIYALQDAKAAEEAAKGAINTAYSALERAVSAEKDAINKQLQAQQDGYQAQIEAAQEAANTIKSIASALASAVKSTQIDSDSFSFQRLQNARSTIGGAASTGNLQYAGLEDALGIAGQDSKKFYGRFEDYAFDQGVLAGNVGKLNDQAQGQLTTAEKTLQALKDQMQASGDQARAQLSALDAQLLEQKNLVDAALGIDNSVLSVKAAIDGLQGAIAGLAAAQAASAIAKAQGSSSILGGAGYGSGGGGGGGGAPYEGPTYTDFMGNQVALQAGQSRQFQDAVAAAGTAAVSGLSELRDRLQALGKSDIWEALSKDLTLNYQDFDHTGGRGVPTISASDGVVSVAGYRHDNQSVQDYAAKISAWAQANGVQGSTNNGYSQSDISNAINTTLGQGASVADILNAGAVNFGLTEQEIREAARAAGIPGFATGINRVPHDMLARIHKDEAVVPAAYNPYNPGASAPGNSEVVAELRKLNERMARIEASSNATAGHTAGTDRKLARVIRNDAMITEALPA